MSLHGDSSNDDPEMNLDALRGALAAHARTNDLEILETSLLSGGAIQENWRVDIAAADPAVFGGERSLVVRKDAPSRLASSLGRVDEFRVMRAMHDAGVLVPTPHFAHAHADLLGSPFAVFGYVEGVAKGHVVVRDPDVRARADALTRQLGRQLALIHRHRASDGTQSWPLPLAGEANPTVAKLDALRAMLDELEVAQPAIVLGMRWLREHAPKTSTAPISVCHGDFRTGNYMVHEGRLVAVLDWEFASWGDPIEDLGWLCAKCWRFRREEREVGGISGVAHLLDGYASVAGHRPTHAAIRYYEVFAHVRWATLALMQARRHTSGEERSLELALTGYLLPELELEIVRATGERIPPEAFTLIMDGGL